MKAKIKQALKILSLIVIIFIVVVLVINTAPFDEELNIEVAKIMQTPTEPAIKGNAYFAMLGITTKPDGDMTMAGYKSITTPKPRINGSVDDLMHPENVPLSEPKPELDISWQQEYESCNSKNNSECLTHMQAQILQTPIKDKNLILMLERYQKILLMHTYENYHQFKWQDYMPLPQFSVMMKLSQISLAQSFMTQQHEIFLNQLNKDIQFWKMAFINGDFLIDKMVAQSAMRNDIYALSYWIKNTDNIAQQELAIIQPLLKPLSHEELDFSESFKAESRMMLSYYQSIESDASFYQTLFYQPNATMNEYYNNHIKKQIDISKLPFHALLEARTKEKKHNSEERRSFKLSDLYNFIGKMLNAYGGCNCSDYIVRVYDLNNIIKMVDIQLQAKTAENQSLSEILKQKENANLYNNKPFDYDEQTKSLKFDCLDSFSQCEIITNNPKD